MIVKGLLWLGQVIAAAIIVSFLSIWTAGYIITSYVDSLLKQYEIPLEIEPLAVSGIWGKLWGADQPSSELVVAVPETATEPIADETGAISSGDDQSVAFEKEPAEAALAPVEESEEVEASTEVALSPEDITEVREAMSEVDKQVMLDILMPKLSPELWELFSAYTEDGLTEQEMIEIQQVMAQHLTDDEYKQLMLILEKY